MMQVIVENHQGRNLSRGEASSIALSGDPSRELHARYPVLVDKWLELVTIRLSCTQRLNRLCEA